MPLNHELPKSRASARPRPSPVLGPVERSTATPPGSASGPRMEPAGIAMSAPSAEMIRMGRLHAVNLRPPNRLRLPVLRTWARWALCVLRVGIYYHTLVIITVLEQISRMGSFLLTG